MAKSVAANTESMYNEFKFGHFSYGEKRKKFDQLLVELIQGSSWDGKKIYDIGCGSGFHMEVCAELGIKKDQMIGVDIAPGNITSLTERGFKAQRADVQALPFADNSADLTICNGVIHHVDDPKKAFRELVRITKPGGRIYLGLCNKWNPYFYLVHRATFPLRYAYWNVDKRVADLILPFFRAAIQLVSYATFGEFMNKETVRRFLMDQIMVPKEFLFSRKMLEDWTREEGGTVEEFKYNRYFLMFSSVLRVNK